jgi:predicted outer membrane protein
METFNYFWTAIAISTIGISIAVQKKIYTDGGGNMKGKILGSLLILMVLAIGLVACGSAADPTSTPRPTQAPMVLPAPSSIPAPAPAASKMLSELYSEYRSAIDDRDRIRDMLASAKELVPQTPAGEQELADAIAQHEETLIQAVADVEAAWQTYALARDREEIRKIFYPDSQSKSKD